MAVLNQLKRPEGFRIIPEGRHTLTIEKVTGTPRTGVTSVTLWMKDENGIYLGTKANGNSYDLTHDGAAGAFWYIANTGCGFDTDNEPLDLDAMVGKRIDVEIVHRNGQRPRADGTFPVFANVLEV